MSSGPQVGYFSLTSSAEPAITGVAPEVPPKTVWPLPVPASAESEAPGAPISGLIVWKLLDGPRADEPTTVSTSGILLAGSMTAEIDPVALRMRFAEV